MRGASSRQRPPYVPAPPMPSGQRYANCASRPTSARARSAAVPRSTRALSAAWKAATAHRAARGWWKRSPAVSSSPRDDTDRLLAAAGFVPAVITRLGAGDPTLLLVAQVLTDSRVSEDERQRLRDVVEAAVRWCRAASR